MPRAGRSPSTSSTKPTRSCGPWHRCSRAPTGHWPISPRASNGTGAIPRTCSGCSRTCGPSTTWPSPRPPSSMHPRTCGRSPTTRPTSRRRDCSGNASATVSPLARWSPTTCSRRCRTRTTCRSSPSSRSTRGAAPTCRPSSLPSPTQGSMASSSTIGSAVRPRWPVSARSGPTSTPTRWCPSRSPCGASRAHK